VWEAARGSVAGARGTEPHEQGARGHTRSSHAGEACGQACLAQSVGLLGLGGPSP
jgi:hypothetical protein